MPHVLLALLLLAADPGFAPPPPAKVLVFAAASLREALDEAGRQYERQTGVKVLASYAASSTLAKQIESGAPADVFISADLEWMDYLASRELIAGGTRANLLTNRLVLICPVAARPQPTALMDVLMAGERIAIANPDHVPAGKYARAALEHFDVWPKIQDKLLPTDNVRIALSLVARGEAPLGIVYRSDAKAEPQVRIVAEFPANSHPAIVYPAAAVAESKNKAAKQFLDYLRTPEARTIFQKHGFETLE
jgi:molybdate transport system substrate-binding protein